MKKLFIITILSILCSLGGNAQEKTEKNNSPSHLTWGLDLAGSIDMTGNAMTSIAIDGFVGYKGDYIRAAALGATANMMMSNSCRSFPIYALFRTSFTKKPSLHFLDLKVGASINEVDSYGKQYGFYSNVGVGITLAQGKDFSSHILVGYSFFDRHDIIADGDNISCPDLHMATIGIGISF